MVEKPKLSSSPQVTRKNDVSLSSEGKTQPERPSSLPSSPAKKKEGSSTSPDGVYRKIFSCKSYISFFIFNLVNFLFMMMIDMLRVLR